MCVGRCVGVGKCACVLRRFVGGCRRMRHVCVRLGGGGVRLGCEGGGVWERCEGWGGVGLGECGRGIHKWPTHGQGVQTDGAAGTTPVPVRLAPAPQWYCYGKQRTHAATMVLLRQTALHTPPQWYCYGKQRTHAATMVLLRQTAYTRAVQYIRQS